MSESERKDTPEQAEFRAHCRDWLRDNHPLFQHDGINRHPWL